GGLVPPAHSPPCFRSPNVRALVGGRGLVCLLSDAVLRSGRGLLAPGDGGGYGCPRLHSTHPGSCGCRAHCLLSSAIPPCGHVPLAPPWSRQSTASGPSCLG